MLGSINELVERSNIPPGDGRLANLNETVKQLQSKISQFRSALSRIEQSPVDSSWIEECRNLQAKIVSIAKVVLQLKKATEGLIEGLTPPKSASKPEEIPVLKAPNETKTNLPPHLLHCTSEKALKLRMKLDEIQLETEKTTEGLRTDPSVSLSKFYSYIYDHFIQIFKLKKLKFDLVKAVVSPLNTLSNESLHSVIDRIMAFFSGNPVEIDTQDRTISLQKHPKSFTFCCEALAKHIVVSRMS